ncbi:MAG: LysR family transcriptional regulator [Burkholderiales bacterium]|nr:LysR family transcriptional regulator [Burkholderiales bacterium]
MKEFSGIPAGLDRAPRATLVQLRSFEAVARLGGVGRAAKSLHLAQPTVSMQLKELSSAVGVPLFEPQGRGLTLTQHGEVLLQTVRDLFAAWQRFEDQSAELQGLKRGRLRIAAVTTTEYFLPDLLGPFAHAHPGIDIELTVQNRDAVVARLERGEDELAAMMLPPQHLPLNRWPFLENPLVVIAPAGHPLTQKKRLKLTQLTDQPLLVREAGSGTRLASEQFMADQGVQWAPRMALGSNEAIKHAVKAGLGLAVLSRHTLPQDLTQTGVAVLPVAGFPIKRMWHLVWRKDRPLSLAARTFLQELRRNLGVRAQPAATP